MKTSDILAKIDALRKSDVKNFQTNYFLTPVEDECFVLENEKAIVFLSLDRDIYRCYFAYVNLNSFINLLSVLPEGKKICLEYITRSDIPQVLFDAINTYLPYETTFIRSRCDIQKLRVLKKCKEDEIEFAEFDDISVIENLLEAAFNHYSSHLPDNCELKSLIENKQVIVTKSLGEITSFIIYKVNQNNVNFDQWISIKKDPQNSMLIINNFYSLLQSQNYRQVYIWVDIKNNKGVQKFHEFYGYKPDGLQDVFFINNLLRKSSK